MTLEQYKKALKAHDWYYAYADSYNDYDKGKEQRNALWTAQPGHDPDFILWNESAPDQFKQIKK
jgi:hypothetical protein